MRSLRLRDQFTRHCSVLRCLQKLNDDEDKFRMAAAGPRTDSEHA